MFVSWVLVVVLAELVVKLRNTKNHAVSCVDINPTYPSLTFTYHSPITHIHNIILS